MKMLRIPLLFLLLSLFSANAEIRTFSGVIEAASSYIHYSEGYLVAPGFVDLSELKFTSLDYKTDTEIYVPGEDDDDMGGDGEGDDDVEPEDGGDDGGDIRLLDAEASAQGSDGSVVS